MGSCGKLCGRLTGISNWIFFGCLLTSATSFSVTPLVHHGASQSKSALYMSGRRHFLGRILAGTSFLLPAPTVHARGLVQFPCEELGNTYHFLRAGQSLMEADDIWSTNPLFLTNREAALSDEGTLQVERTCEYLRDTGITPTIVMYSLAASAMDTAGIIGKELKVGRDRLVPEFTYLDPRAIGKWDMLPYSSTQAAVWAMDADEAGADGRGARPPPNEDSTPNETLDNQATRLRQLLSLMETQYSGDTVILVFPDGTGPALLSAMIAGIPLNRVHELEYRPGEVRLDVTMQSTNALLKNGKSSEYTAALESGRTELKRLRSLKAEDVVSVKDQKLEEERKEMEAYSKQLEEKRRAKEEQDRLARDARTRQIEQDRQRRREEMGDESDNSIPIVAGTTAVGGAAAAATLFSGGDDDEQEMSANEKSPVNNPNATEAIPIGDAALNVGILDRPLFDLSTIGENNTLTPTGNDEDSFMPALGINNDEASSNEETSMQRVNGDRVATFPPPSKSRDPVKAAEEAMQEYMERDDGGSEWLQMMSDLMLETDDEDDNTLGP